VAADANGLNPTNRRSAAIAAAGAVGGALLTLGVQVVVEAYKEWRVEVRTDDQKKSDQTDELIAEYERLEDVPRKAQAYLDGGKEGSPADVRALYRHFRKLVILTLNGSVKKNTMLSYYGGSIRGWAGRFEAISYSQRANKFSAIENENFKLVGAALRELSLEIPSIGTSSAAEELYESANAVDAESDDNISYLGNEQ
jgi:hypothetical protein